MPQDPEDPGRLSKDQPTAVLRSRLPAGACRPLARQKQTAALLAGESPDEPQRERAVGKLHRKEPEGHRGSCLLAHASSSDRGSLFSSACRSPPPPGSAGADHGSPAGKSPDELQRGRALSKLDGQGARRIQKIPFCSPLLSAPTLRRSQIRLWSSKIALPDSNCSDGLSRGQLRKLVACGWEIGKALLPMRAL